MLFLAKRKVIKIILMISKILNDFWTVINSTKMNFNMNNLKSCAYFDIIHISKSKEFCQRLENVCFSDELIWL